jgi:hypothetical protein
MRWEEVGGFPSPTYRLRVAGWPSGVTGGPAARPVVEAWWSDAPTSSGADAGLSLRRGDDFRSLGELAGRAYPIDEGRLIIEGVSVERHAVEVAPGRLEEVSCLVVRARSEGGPTVWLELLGAAVAGSEHRYYSGRSRVSALFWPLGADVLDADSIGLAIRSVGRLRELAGSSGRSARFDGLPAPSIGGPPAGPASLPELAPAPMPGAGSSVILDGLPPALPALQSRRSP